MYNAKTQDSIIKLMEDNIKLIESEKEKTQDKNKRRKWNRYKGDVVCRIFREFILKELPNYTISFPNAYVIGFPTEFDLLILDKDSKPEKFSNAFQPEKVRFGFEIKTHGLFGGREEMESEITKIKQKFLEVNKRYHNIRFVYLTYQERTETKRKSSINYLEETKRILEPQYPVFCLKDSGENAKPIEGEWDRLINHIKKYL